jgi:hypothetical protein
MKVLNFKITLKAAVLLLLGSFMLQACNDDSAVIIDDDTDKNSDDVPAVYQKIKNVEDIYLEGNYVVIKTKNLPDHKSTYYEGTQWEAALYESYQGSNSQYHTNPNRVTEQNLTFRIPINPNEAGVKKATPLGAIGVSVNGISIFNQYAAPGDDLEQEINTFDHYNGHPQQQGLYHYHLEPLWLTQTNGKEDLIGFLLDGFPVYGPEENGKVVTNTDLDAYHGHDHATADFPDGIYHYHVTSEDPYINGDGFYGTAGTVSN